MASDKGKKLGTCTITYYDSGLMDVKWSGVVGISVKMIQKSWQLMFRDFRLATKQVNVAQRAKEREATKKAAEEAKASEEAVKKSEKKAPAPKSENFEQGNVLNV